MPKWFVQIKKNFRCVEQEKLKKHFYCMNCNSLSSNTNYDINHDESIENEEILSDMNSCAYDVNDKSKYFIEIPLMFQLK